MAKPKQNIKVAERSQRYRKIDSYTDLITQPLTKGMFVPCDEEGNVLEEPKGYFEWSTRTIGTSLTELELHLIEPKCLQYQPLRIVTGKHYPLHHKAQTFPLLVVALLGRCSLKYMLYAKPEDM